MRKLLLFLLFVLVALTACALIPWQIPGSAPMPTLAATITPVRIDPATAAPSFATETAVPEPTQTMVMVPTVLPSQTEPPAPLTIQPGTPRYLPAFPHADLGCDWAGVAGQVLSPDREGATGAVGTGAVVVISGSVNGQVVEGMALAGSAPGYGPGGYEVDLSAYRGLSGGTAQIQVFDLNGQPLSGAFSFNLPPACAENLALITFHSSSTANTMYLPVIH